MHDFKLGQRVKKKHGYKFPGVVVSVFSKLDGSQRYVVECASPDVAGILHIFSAKDLEPLDYE